MGTSPAWRRWTRRSPWPAPPLRVCACWWSRWIPWPTSAGAGGRLPSCLPGSTSRSTVRMGFWTSTRAAAWSRPRSRVAPTCPSRSSGCASSRASTRTAVPSGSAVRVTPVSTCAASSRSFSAAGAASAWARSGWTTVPTTRPTPPCRRGPSVSSLPSRATRACPASCTSATRPTTPRAPRTPWPSACWGRTASPKGVATCIALRRGPRCWSRSCVWAATWRLAARPRSTAPTTSARQRRCAPQT